MGFIRKKEAKRFCPVCGINTNHQICPECKGHTSIRMMRACRDCRIETLKIFCPKCGEQTGDISGSNDFYQVNDKHRKCQSCDTETDDVLCPECGQQTVRIS